MQLSSWSAKGFLPKGEMHGVGLMALSALGRRRGATRSFAWCCEALARARPARRRQAGAPAHLQPLATDVWHMPVPAVLDRCVYSIMPGWETARP